jgi:hypothetical protein
MIRQVNSESGRQAQFTATTANSKDAHAAGGQGQITVTGEGGVEDEAVSIVIRHTNATGPIEKEVSGKLGPNGDGTITITGLPADTYHVRVTATPPGPTPTVAAYNFTVTVS